MIKKKRRQWKKANYQRRKSIIEQDRRTDKKELLRSRSLNYKLKIINEPILSFLHNTKFYKKRHIDIDNKYEVNFAIPRIFSFTENPDETIEALQRLYSISLLRDVENIFVDHSHCEVLGIGASTVMDIFILSLKKDRNQRGKKLTLHGILSSSTQINDIIYVSGLLKHLGITKYAPTPINIRKLDLINGGKGIQESKDPSGKSGVASTLIVEYYNECLATQGFIFTSKGQNQLTKMIGEVINNCELHSGKFCRWYALGHFSLDEEKGYGICHLVIFNFGQTIYEGLKDSTTTDDMKSRLNNMTKLHSGFLGFGGWDEELLWTLYALQESVSRKYDKEKDPTRGNGTIELIDNFQIFGDTKNENEVPMMSLISGNTHILFDQKYKLSENTMDNGEERKVIAFNKENDLRKPPDIKNVKKLKNYFPGTIISMKFYLQRSYIEQIIEEG